MPVATQEYGPNLSPIYQKLEAHYRSKGCSERKAREVASRKVRRQGIHAARFLEEGR